jgi:hypothetical protein
VILAVVEMLGVVTSVAVRIAVPTVLASSVVDALGEGARGPTLADSVQLTTSVLETPL